MFGSSDVTGQPQSSVIEYYWNRAGAIFLAQHPDSAGLTYVLHATTFYRHVNKHGLVTSTDTTRAAYYYSWGKLDSARVVGKGEVPLNKVKLAWPNIFEGRYRLNFYPNDTGGTDLAIGFDTDSSGSALPTGMVIINRTTYQPRWLYLYYPSRGDYERLTRSFRFAPQGNFVFPDSVWEVGAIAGIFTNEYYRVETGITGVEIKR